MAKKYDVVIIGAGISGLVAGNYLAKAGLKVLIAEQHYAVGGCCSYFKRGGFTFDCGAHSLGSFRKGGQFQRIFEELELVDKLKIKRAKITDTILTQTQRLDFYNSISETLDFFPKSLANFKDRFVEFINFVDGFDTTKPSKLISYYSKYKDKTFDTLFKDYCIDADLKDMICALFGNLGLPSTRLSSLAGLAMLKEFVLDGGYFVDGGMKTFSQFLSTSFKNFGGDLKLRKRAERICINNKEVSGVIFNDEKIETNTVISTTGIQQTFLKMIGLDFLPNSFASKISKLAPSVSGLILYLGLKKEISNNYGRALWYVPKNNADSIYEDAYLGRSESIGEMLLITQPSIYDDSLAPKNQEVVILFSVAPFISQDFWRTDKNAYKEDFLLRASKIIPDLQNYLVVEELATPSTLLNFTLNDEGAMYGLASILKQTKSSMMPQRTIIPGLYLASHWTTVGAGQGGTPMAAFSGRQAARLVMSKEEKVLGLRS